MTFEGVVCYGPSIVPSTAILVGGAWTKSRC